jgi:hypothetical protein
MKNALRALLLMLPFVVIGWFVGQHTPITYPEYIIFSMVYLVWMDIMDIRSKLLK